MRRCLDKLESMRGRRRIDDLYIEARGAVEVIELFEGGISLSAGELLRQASVERIFQDAFARRRSLDEALDQPVPCALDVEHHRGELELRVETRAGQAARIDSGGLGGKPFESERVTQTA